MHQQDFLYRKKAEKTIMLVFVTFLGLIWSIPIIAAVNKALAFNGWQNFYDIIFGDIGGIKLHITYLNSFIIALQHAFFVVAVSSLAGYGFAYLDFKYKEGFYFIVLMFMAVPATSILVPLFFITRELGLRDTLVGISLPEAALTLPFGVLLMRNFADGISRSYIEAAIIDGAVHWKIFFQIFMPIAKPAAINLATLSMMWSMQDFLFPSLFLIDPEKTTAAQAVMRFKEYLGATPDDIGRYNASLVLLAIPALIIIVFGLRFITQGLTSGGVKE
ncbi:carbohydrate ABC transporter permease [Parasalinivibrio latis]|uniref:carbohydrate ABC transporter permease n=1 Tax=Parasalinivibrio latis TaxID=2952610 RepID=UPI0030E17DEB